MPDRPKTICRFFSLGDVFALAALSARAKKYSLSLGVLCGL
jgi:hypothetical protein